MALMLGKLHEALIAGNVPPDKAREASEEVAGFEGRLARTESDLTGRVAKVEADLTLLKWMVGTNILITVGVLWKVLTLP